MTDSATIIGKRFGHWMVITVTGRRATCQCRCGTIRVISIDALESGNAPSSCGCSRMPSKEIEKLRDEKAEWERQRDLKDWRPGDRSSS